MVVARVRMAVRLRLGLGLPLLLGFVRGKGVLNELFGAPGIWHTKQHSILNVSHVVFMENHCVATSWAMVVGCV